MPRFQRNRSQDMLHVPAPVEALFLPHPRPYPLPLESSHPPTLSQKAQTQPSTLPSLVMITGGLPSSSQNYVKPYNTVTSSDPVAKAKPLAKEVIGCSKFKSTLCLLICPKIRYCIRLLNSLHVNHGVWRGFLYGPHTIT